MHAEARAVLTGTHFLNGDQACCEGALAAGARFAAGYPITPSTEIVERFALRIPLVGGVFIQMEDELAASIAIQGAVWAGAKAFTVTSGPGFSLMMEHIGYAAMTETPCVFVNVQRGGPSTGLPTLPAQADMMQARFGSHGDYPCIALSPVSPQECFTLMIRAMNLAEEFRTPVFLMMDEVVGHMTERVEIPAAEAISVTPRNLTSKSPEDYRPYETNGCSAPEMAVAGEGYKFHVTGLTHDERGYPSMSAATQHSLVTRLLGKVESAKTRIIEVEEEHTEDAEVVVISYGITMRVAERAIRMAREEGIATGKLRLVTVWPLADEHIRQLAGRVKAFVVPELNMGQVVLEVERAVRGRARVIPVPHAGGAVHQPEQILEAIRQGAAQ